MNIAIVEDESLTALFISETLEDLGHNIVGCFDSASPLLETVLELNIDLVFMDIEINGKMDGIECAVRLQTKYKIPSIFITSYQNSATINDAMDALPLGYLIKPVTENEIEASLAVACKSIKPIQSKNNEYLQLGDYIYYFLNKTLTYHGELIKLSKNEYKVLDILCNANGNLVESKMLTQNIWVDEDNKEDSLRELIYRLRKKLPNLTINSLSKTGYYISA